MPEVRIMNHKQSAFFGWRNKMELAAAHKCAEINEWQSRTRACTLIYTIRAKNNHGGNDLNDDTRIKRSSEGICQFVVVNKTFCPKKETD